MGGGGGFLGLGGGNGSSFTAQGTGTDQGYLNEGAIQQNQAVAGEQNLANQLQQQALGQGPNPAQSQFQQNVGQINAQQAGNVASTKGINPALAAYMSNQQAGQNLQNAAGSAATLQAQQQLAAQGQLAGLQGNIANQGLGAAQIGQSGINSANQANAGVASTNAQSSNSAGQGILGGLGAAIGLARGGSVPNYDQGGGILGTVKQLAPLALLNEGGRVPMYASGGLPGLQGGVPLVNGQTPWPSGIPGLQGGQQLVNGQIANSSSSSSSSPTGPSSNVGKSMTGSGGLGLSGLLSPITGGISSVLSPITGAIGAGLGAIGSGLKAGTDAIGATKSSDSSDSDSDDTESAAKGGMMARGGKVPAKVSPGEGYLNPQMLRQVLSSPNKGKAAIDKSEKIPGKAKVKGDSYANDTVDKTLQAGGLVLPRSVMNSKNPAKDAAAFVTAHLAKKGDRGMRAKRD